MYLEVLLRMLVVPLAGLASSLQMMNTWWMLGEAKAECWGCCADGGGRCRGGRGLGQSPTSPQMPGVLLLGQKFFPIYLCSIFHLIAVQSQLGKGANNNYGICLMGFGELQAATACSGNSCRTISITEAAPVWQSCMHAALIIFIRSLCLARTTW